jgi:plasmid rolling circle replication initiator protein Rep
MPAQQFLETVIIAASSDPKPEDRQDLVWMKDNLKTDIMNDPSTLRKTLGDGKVAKVIDTWPMMREVFMELGLIALNDDDSIRSVSSNPSSTCRRETDPRCYFRMYQAL